MVDRLLDTNAISAAMGGHRSLQAYLARVADDGAIVTSVIAEGEIRFGIARLSPGRRKRTLTHALEVVLDSVSDILPVSRGVAGRYGALKADLWAAGTPMGENDLWLAATALTHGLVLVTDDAAFPHVPGLRVENWSHP